MNRSKLIYLGLAAGIVAGVTPALARSPSRHYQTPYSDTLPTSQQIGVPFNSRDVGIPGPNYICVKECRRDSSPCDPPSYKQADGRCSFLF